MYNTKLQAMLLLGFIILPKMTTRFLSTVVVVAAAAVLLLYVHGKQLWSCREGQLT